MDELALGAVGGPLNSLSGVAVDQPCDPCHTGEIGGVCAVSGVVLKPL